MKLSFVIFGLMIGLFVNGQSAPAAAPTAASTTAPASAPVAASAPAEKTAEPAPTGMSAPPLTPGEHDHSGIVLPRMFSHEHGLRVKSEPSRRQADCPISTDQVYGLTLENPVQIGGDLGEGNRRKIAYLKILRGAKGTGLEIYRLGASGSKGEIVDVYEVRFADGSNPVLIFLSQYSYASPKIPDGFTCSSKIPFGAPE